MNKVTITSGPAQSVSASARPPAGLTITRPGSPGPHFEQAITNTADLIVRATDHRVPNPSAVTVTDQVGNVILANVRIEPGTGDVHFHSSKPLTGFIYII